MSEWREVHIEFTANDDAIKDKLASFMAQFIEDHPDYFDPGKSEFSDFGWIRKWDEQALSVHEDEHCTAWVGFHDRVLPFFEELNAAVRGISYEGELTRFDNGGEFCKQTRKVSFDGKEFTSNVDFWFEGDEEQDWQEPQKPAASPTAPITEGKIVKSGRANKYGNAFSWTLDENGTLSIYAESSDDVINGFEWDKLPWRSLVSKIIRAQFSSKIRAKKLDNLFNCCCYMEEVLGINQIDSSELTSMNGMFIDCEELKGIDISALDTSHVIDMGELFNGCTALEGIDMSMLDTSSVENMYWMFVSCESLKSANLATLNFTQVLNMGGMFEDCESLECVDLSTEEPPAAPDVSSMFKGCDSLASVNLTGWDEVDMTGSCLKDK